MAVMLAPNWHQFGALGWNQTTLHWGLRWVKGNRVSSKQLKEDREKAIGNQLLKALKLDGKLLRHGKDGIEPDLIYSLEGKTLGIEISTAHYDEGTASVEFKMARGEIKPDPPRWVLLGVPNEPDKVMVSRVQRELDDKCEKHYSGVDAAWLCIEQRAHLSTVADTEKLIAAIKVPNNEFERIYLVFNAPMNDGGGFRVFLLSRKRRSR